MIMDLADLRLFRAVAEEGSVTRAAQRLHTVQSNVTTRLRLLEESLGTPLFDRINRRLVITPAGSLLESYADRLMALFVGIADANKDGDITEDEQGVLEVALNAAWDYLVKCGATEEDAGALLNDWDDEAADRVRDLVASVLPEGDDEASAEIDSFVFSESDQEPALDAVYKMKMAVRGGKKMRIRKRISGTVRLSAKQKLAIRKARMKSHSAGAMMRRMKSMRMRRKMGI